MNKTKKYKIIYADPPWSYQDKKCNGNAQDHYPTQSLGWIKSLGGGVQKIVDKDCVLFLWATYPLLPEALEVIKAWGFEYKSIAFQWVKLNKKNGKPFYGLGRWTRGNTEACLLAVRGKPKRVSNSVFQLIFSPIENHSKKPQEAREKIVKLIGDVPRLELFARNTGEKNLFGKNPLDGWDTWGDEVKNSIEL